MSYKEDTLRNMELSEGHRLIEGSESMDTKKLFVYCISSLSEILHSVCV